MSLAVRLSVDPAVPETTAVPPPMSTATLSRVVVPSAISTRDVPASLASTPRMVACPDASSMTVRPFATWTRPEARAGMSETVAPPSKPVQPSCRDSLTSMPFISVEPEVTVAACTLPATCGAAT
ncbi:hypothetical protein [Mesorhizobium marinum]|uniref:hypothetical protein n=1 Tax=Mesorhizobium marinum TaxID=3228790 RepID=UPI0034654D11